MTELHRIGYDTLYDMTKGININSHDGSLQLFQKLNDEYVNLYKITNENLNIEHLSESMSDLIEKIKNLGTDYNGKIKGVLLNENKNVEFDGFLITEIDESEGAFNLYIKFAHID